MNFILNDETATFVTANGGIYTLSRQDQRVVEAMEAIRDRKSDEEVIACLDPKALLQRFSDGDIEVNELGELIVKSMPNEHYPESIGKRIWELASGGFDYRPLYLFLLNLQQNPSRRAIQELYAFLEHGNMPITPSGNFIGYKGLQANYWSIHAGDRTKVKRGKTDEEGHIYNGVGEVIRVDDNYVDDDARVSCSTGLHVGTESYATGFAQGRVVLVEVRPQDVISVPFDSDCQKLRCSGYRVIADYQGTLDNTEVDPEAPYDESADDGDGDDASDNLNDEREAFGARLVDAVDSLVDLLSELKSRAD